MSLRNIRTENGRVLADFTVDDGREGCIWVPEAEYLAHGEAVLQQQATAAQRWARVHGFEAPGVDRYEELG